MTEANNDVTRQVTELRERVDQLQKQVESLKGNRSVTISERPRSEEVLNPNLFQPGEVIPPSPQDDVHSIVGGEKTNDFPDCCAVGNDIGYYCTGTLIAPTVVVTAAHCDGIRRVFLRGPDVRFPEDGETIRVSRVFRHDEADLQVLVLESPSAVEPRRVASGAVADNAQTAILVGFGTTNLAGTTGYGRKRKVEVPIVSASCATQNDVDNFGCSRGTEIVAGHRGLRKDSCKGDSGGPLYVKGPGGAHFLLGATSRGINNADNVCGDGGIYVRVDKFLDWIREMTGVAIA
jgi:hypothetical protein